MAEIEAIVLEHARDIRDAIDDMPYARMKRRTGNLENRHASMSNRLDRTDLHVEQIERHLDLLEA
jgi:hypothetical protein